MGKILFALVFVFAFCFVALGQESPCPKVSVTGPPAPLAPKAAAIFTASVDERIEDLKLEYFWSVDKGKILHGQGTVVITVGEIPWDTILVATVEIKGLPEGCLNTASEATVLPHSPMRPIEIKQLKTSAPRLDKLKFDKLLTALKDDLDATTYIIIYNNEKTSRKKLKQKEQQIRKYLSNKNVPADRIIVIYGGEGADLIRLFIVPAGAELPTP